MATVYTYSEARQNLAALLDRVLREGEILIKRQDGTTFVVKAAPRKGSPLDVEGITLNLSRDEIVTFVQAGRRFSSDLTSPASRPDPVPDRSTA
jgi:hypothetical protein